MVRILANGDIVQDDDPRVKQDNSGYRNRSAASATPEDQYRQYQAQGDTHQHQHQHEANGPTVFDTWNQKLLDLGIPRWNVGSHVVEPLITVMFLFVLLFFGLPGALFLGLLYFVMKLSQRQPNVQQQSGGRAYRPQQGGGRRLGR